MNEAFSLINTKLYSYTIMLQTEGVLKGIRYSNREGNDVANVKCYFRDVKLYNSTYFYM